MDQNSLSRFKYNIGDAKRYLFVEDIDDLNHLYFQLTQGRKPTELMLFASKLETIVREVIPPSVWKAMGGKVLREE